MEMQAYHTDWEESDADTELDERVRSAARNNDIPALQDALAAGASAAPFWDESHPSTTEYAISHGNHAMLKLLIEAGADPAQPGADGGLLIQYAAWGGHVEILEYLLGDTCRLPADYAGIYQQFDSCQRSHPLHYSTPLASACEEGRVSTIRRTVDRLLECARILVAHGADVNFTHQRM